jgi:shikimate dehydrogenase
MSSLFDFDKPALYAVMGNPVSHSKSPRIHGLFAEQTGQRLQYTAIQVDPGGFEQAVRNFVANGGRGLNVTVPFKTNAWELSDTRTPRAESAGAVNTIVVQAQGVLHGDNTDGAGLINDIVKNQGGVIAGRSILLLGAGGAARGVLGPLLEQRPRELLIVNRTADRAVALAQSFSRLGAVAGCGYDDLAERRFDLVVNATSASLHGELPPLPDRVLAEGAWCYDMMYGAAPTPFMRWAEQRRAGKVSDGLGMLVEQAAESFFLWRGVRPETAPVIALLRRELAKNG